MRLPFVRERFRPDVSQREAAVAWLIENQKIWKGKEIQRYAPMDASRAWMACAAGLQVAGIYSPKTSPWDLRLEHLVALAEASIRAGRIHATMADVTLKRPELKARTEWIRPLEIKKGDITMVNYASGDGLPRAVRCVVKKVKENRKDGTTTLFLEETKAPTEYGCAGGIPIA